MKLNPLALLIYSDVKSLLGNGDIETNRYRGEYASIQ